MTGFQVVAGGRRAARVQIIPKREGETEETFFALTPLMSRREAELMFEMDAAQSGQSLDWTSYFVETMVEFLVFGKRPTGRITDEDAKWLMSMLGENFSPSVPKLFRALVLQAEDLPPVLLQYAMTCGAMRAPGSSMV